jgi:uncharacterized protein YcaQ
MRTISLETTRKLTITKQHLDGSPIPSMLDVIRALGCLQLDPISPVARSHEIVLFSRLGNYDAKDLETIRFKEFQVFEYWAHAASMVLTEDYPLFAYYINRYATNDSERAKTIREWVKHHESLKQVILTRLREEGALPSRAFESHSPQGTFSIGWTSGRDVTDMMDYLWNSGQVVVAGREGTQRLWGLAEQFLPEWTPREELQPEQITEHATLKAIKALGIATEAQIKRHFTRGRYTQLSQCLKKLEKAGIIQEVQVHHEDGSPLWKAPAYIHTDDLALLDHIEAGNFIPRTTVLSPFDNLICDRERTEQLWDFYFRIEIYVPKAKRQYGYYVLPILHGDKLIGRIDPQYDRKTRTLKINSVYKEDSAPDDAETVKAIRESIQQLAVWRGAESIEYSTTVPSAWWGIIT